MLGNDTQTRMEEFLKKVKLIDEMEITLPIGRTEFASRLREVTDEGSVGLLSSPFEVFSSSKKEFKGDVTNGSFKIKRRQRIFDATASTAIAEGTFSERNDSLVIRTQVNGFSNAYLVLYGALVLFFVFVIVVFLQAGIKDATIAIPIILIQSVIMLGLPYFMMRRSVKRLKYDLEREFFYFTKAR